MYIKQKTNSEHIYIQGTYRNIFGRIFKKSLKKHDSIIINPELFEIVKGKPPKNAHVLNFHIMTEEELEVERLAEE